MSVTSFINGKAAIALIKNFGSPLYVYNQETIRQRYRELKSAFSVLPHVQLFYAMKANSNLHILKILREEGAFLDCVSIYEAELGFLAGFKANQMLFTVNNMSDEEMQYAHNKGILLNIDSLSRLERYGQAYPRSNVCIRLTPEVTVGHHAKVQTGYKESKFGILFEEIFIAVKIAKKNHLKIIGLHEHTGSGITNMYVALQGIKRMLTIARHFPHLEFLDFGGGFPTQYKPTEKQFDINGFARKLAVSSSSFFCQKHEKKLQLYSEVAKYPNKEKRLHYPAEAIQMFENKSPQLYLEPGRYCVAEAGILLCTVTCLKKRGKKIVVGVDTGFNHLVRPVLYDSYHHIVNLTSEGKMKKYDVYGNICESGDCFGKERMIREIHEGDILAILDAGAYGFSMASQYNSRLLPAEVIISEGNTLLIRKRQTFEDIVKNNYQ